MGEKEGIRYTEHGGFVSRSTVLYYKEPISLETA